MIKTLFLHEISRCLFLYRVHLFRISVTGMPFSFFITFCTRCGMEWDTACRPTDDPFWAFLSPGAQEPVHPQTIFVYFRQLKNILYVLGIHPKKIIIPASFHSKAFVLLYKFETSWALIGRLSRGFFAISGANLNSFSWPFYLAC